MIELKNVIKKFDDKVAVDDFTMQIQNQEIVGVIGANGAGKSTLMRMLAGVILPDSGEILIDNQKIEHSLSLKRQVFFFPDEQYFFQGATIKETAQFYAIFYKSFDFSVFNRLCESFELNPKEKIVKLSKGMKRQVIMIIGIAIRPAYMLLDEVFDGIDSVTKQTFKNVLERLVSEYGTTIITASHNIREIQDICKSVCLIYKSKLILHKDIAVLQASYENGPTINSLEEILLHELEVLGYASKIIDYI